MKAVAARTAGDVYQGRFFWLRALSLLDPSSHVREVRYEDDGPRGFDDVVTFYDAPVVDMQGRDVLVEYFQLKYHMTMAGAFTWEALHSPAFVNTKEQTLLKALKRAAEQVDVPLEQVRFHAVSPWPVHPDDELAALVRERAIDLDRLAEGGDRSEKGIIRRTWRDHLALSSDDELFELLRSLRVWTQPDLTGTLDLLNVYLKAAGLKQVDAAKLSNPYDDLRVQLTVRGQVSFTREGLVEVLDREQLWAGSSPRTRVAIRSFERGAEVEEVRHDIRLDAIFGGKRLLAPERWRTEVAPAVTSSLECLKPGSSIELHLNAHASIAFLAGYTLDSKSGVETVLVQRTRGRLVPWDDAGSVSIAPGDLWKIEKNPRGSGEIAVAVSVTHAISEDVRSYVLRALPAVTDVVSVVVRPAPSSTVVMNGAHALGLAQELARIMRDLRVDDQALHLFVAAPNALTFYLGQLGRALGALTLYEHDFEAPSRDAYVPSLSFPLLPSNPSS